MPANIKEPIAVPLWFQSPKIRPHGGLLHSLGRLIYALERSYNYLRRMAHQRAIFSRLMSEAET